MAASSTDTTSKAVLEALQKLLERKSPEVSSGFMNFDSRSFEQKLVDLQNSMDRRFDALTDKLHEKDKTITTLTATMAAMQREMDALRGTVCLRRALLLAV
jgi:hypothetical protein